jgi:phosphatidylglycerol:prolipoprotein diacylglycerol transferase
MEKKMKNNLITIGGYTVHGYGLMIAIGIIAAYLVAEFRAKRKNLDHEKIFSLTIWCFLGGILGAKLLYYITEIKSILADPSILLDVGNGFVVYGGIIGGIFAGFLFCKRYKLNFFRYFDLVMPSIALAQGFGRLGCFLAGCCYGLETNSILGIIFHESDYAPNGIRLIPTQLISSGLDFLNFLALVLISKRVKADGQVAGFYLIFYSVGRFILEFYRGDLIRGSVGVLSTSQFISIFLLLFGCILTIVRGRFAKMEMGTETINETANETENETVNETEEK